MFGRSDSVGKGRLASRSSLVRPNFCMVEKMIPPDALELSSWRRCSRDSACTGVSGRFRAGAKTSSKQLVVEVVAVGQQHYRRVRHRRVAHHLVDVEEHLQALARALSVPDDARPTVPSVDGGDGRADRLVDRVELVVLRQLLHQPTALVREGDEFSAPSRGTAPCRTHPRPGPPARAGPWVPGPCRRSSSRGRSARSGPGKAPSWRGCPWRRRTRR